MGDDAKEQKYADYNYKKFQEIIKRLERLEAITQPLDRAQPVKDLLLLQKTVQRQVDADGIYVEFDFEPSDVQ